MRALVYRGPAALPGCAEAVAELLSGSRWDFDVCFAGPAEDVDLTADALKSAVLYCQPGGASLGEAYRHLRPQRKAIRRFVRGGGRYLGFCLGGYLAGATPGFDLLPGDTDQYVTSRHASLRTEDSAVVEVDWRGRRRRLFFQDGPIFTLDRGADVTVLATYRNATVAALVTSFGSGHVGVVGPHPEATEDWFTDVGLDVPEPLATDVGHDLVDAVMSA